MKITITTPTNAPYGIHANTIADLLKRALATFALQREEDQVLVEHERKRRRLAAEARNYLQGLIDATNNSNDQ